MAGVITSISNILVRIGLEERGTANFTHQPPEPTAQGRSPSQTGNARRQGKDYGQYKPIVDALRESLNEFIHGTLQGEISIDPNLCCRIDEFQIRPMAVGAQDRLRDLINRHPARILAGMLVSDVLPWLHLGDRFDFSAFSGIKLMDWEPKREPLREESSEEQQSDIRQIIANFQPPQLECVKPDTKDGEQPYEILIVWVPISKAALNTTSNVGMLGRPGIESAGTLLPSASEAWHIEDARGVSHVALPEGGSENKLILGKGPDADIFIDGAFTSGRHGALWFENGHWWYQDLGSTNGSKVVRPGGADIVFPQRGQPKGGKQRCQIEPGCVIIFAAERTTPTTDYPHLTYTVRATSSATPVIPAAAAAQEPAAGVTMAKLIVNNADGQWEMDLIAADFPFMIGRTSRASLVVSEAHTTVSSEHLRIEGIDPEGARLKLVKGWGVVMGGSHIIKSGDIAVKEFIWPWNTPLLLNVPDSDDPVCSLLLRRP